MSKVSVFFVSILMFSSDISATEIAGLKTFNRAFAEAVKTYWRPSVTIHGIGTTVFNFKGLANEWKTNPKHPMRRAEEALKTFSLKDISKGSEEKAFLINLYNFGAMRMVIDHYPVDSIRSFKISVIRYPWSAKNIRVGKEEYSLKQIEKEILLKKHPDPRVVFAVSCAAVSCPDRTNQIFYANRLDSQMDEMIRKFLKNEQKGFRLNKAKKVLTLSWIFDKDGHLFKGKETKNALDFVLRFVDSKTSDWIRRHRPSLSIQYFDHDWALNDLALKDK